MWAAPLGGSRLHLDMGEALQEPTADPEHGLSKGDIRGFEHEQAHGSTAAGAAGTAAAAAAGANTTVRESRLKSWSFRSIMLRVGQYALQQW